MITAKHFKIYELVDKKIYDEFGETAWQFIDPYMIWTLDALREYYNSPIIINDWYNNGKFDSRGFRASHDKTGAKYSIHKTGKAFDLIFTKKGLSVDQIRDDIKCLYAKQDTFRFINAIEDNVSWLHIDGRNCKRLMVF